MSVDGTAYSNNRQKTDHNKMKTKKTKANETNYLEEKCQKTLLIEVNSYQRGRIFFLFCGIKEL